MNGALKLRNGKTSIFIEKRISAGDEVAYGVTRFIPACAGNSPARQSVVVQLCGSSPRVRGTVRICLRQILSGRFIPACAGNRIPQMIGRYPLAVHPRVCGEQVRKCIRCISAIRFIPACAGNRESMLICHFSSPVHPRVCGEQTSFSTIVLPSAGSSPRVRGTGPQRVLLCDRHRFIPACAGNSGPHVKLIDGRTVHPRVCGEQAPRDAYSKRTCGSSPRVRGTVHKIAVAQRRDRFIPACAGNRR